MRDAAEQNVPGSDSGHDRAASAAETLPAGDPRGIRHQAHDSRDRSRLPAFDPLRFCPADKRARYARRGAAAERQPRQAIMAKCLDCCACEHREVKRCAIATCPLFALSVRYFGRADAGAPDAADDVTDESSAGAAGALPF